MNKDVLVVRVPQAVLDGIDAVRISGKTNMLAYNAVMKLAMDMEYYETVVWMKDNKTAYSEGIFAGFGVRE